MKKFISALLVAVMMLSCVVSVSAEEAVVEYVVKADIVGDEIHLSLDIVENSIGLWVAVLYMQYNGAAVECVSIDTDESAFDMIDADDMSKYDMGDYIYILGEGSDSFEDMTGACNVFKAVFRILDAGKDWGFSLDTKDGKEGFHINANGEEVPFTVSYTGSAYEKPEPAPVENGWFETDGKWYFYENGTMVKSAWRKDSIGWCWLTETGAMATNAWVMDSKGWCYIGADGYAVTNCWKMDSVGWCYLDSEGSQVKNAWIEDGGKWYFVDADGYMVSNAWRKDSKGWVFLGADGAMVTNAWVRDSVGWCYVGADGYAETNCWKQDSIGWCYLNSEGSMTKNSWVNDGGKWYYIDGDGYMVSYAWLQDGSTWYFLGSDGAMVTGWQFIGGTWYNFDSNGVWIG